MGLFDFLESVVWGIEDGIDAITDIAEDVVGLKQDLDDLVVSTFTLGSEVECASDIRAEADNIIRGVEEKYKENYDEMQSILSSLSREWKKLQEEKIYIAKRLNYDYHESIKIPTELSMHGLNAPQKGKIVDYERIFSALLPSDYSSDPLKYVKKWSASSQRLEEAREYREEARVYEANIDLKIAEMNGMKKYTERIKELFKEEQKILDILKKFMKSSTALQYHKIASKIELLLSAELLDKNGRINCKYEQTVNELSKLINC